MPQVTRKGDSCTGHECFPPRVSTGGSPDVFVNGIPVHRVGDSWAAHTCTHPKVPHGTHASSLGGGSGRVFANGNAVGRVGDPVSCGGSVASGSGNVFAGDGVDTVRVEQWNDIRSLALMSIGTDKGSWWADPSFGSELWLLRKNGKVDGQTAGTLRRMVLESLEWITASSLASKIECTAERTGKNEIRYSVNIFRPTGNRVLITEVWRAV